MNSVCDIFFFSGKVVLALIETEVGLPFSLWRPKASKKIFFLNKKKRRHFSFGFDYDFAACECCVDHFGRFQLLVGTTPADDELWRRLP